MLISAEAFYEDKHGKTCILNKATECPVPVPPDVIAEFTAGFVATIQFIDEEWNGEFILRLVGSHLNQ